MVRWPALGAAFFLSLMVRPVRAATTGGVPMWQGILWPALVAAYGACYLGFPWILFRPRPVRVKLAFCAGMLLLGWLMLLLVHNGSIYVLIYAMAVIAFGLPPAWSLILDGTSLAVAAVLIPLRVGAHGSMGDLGTVVGVTAALFFVGRLLHTVRNLRAANDEIATLAV